MQEKWTIEQLKISAKKYKNRYEWEQMDKNAYQAATKRKITHACCEHMTPKPHRWTVEELKEDALKYSTRNQWKHGSSGYSSALTKGILDECCSHMELQYKNWSREEILQYASKYNSVADWRKNHSRTYNAALRRNIINECTVHMISRPIKWTEQLILQDALKYHHRSDWVYTNPNGYNAAHRFDILEKACAHMTPKPSCFSKNIGVIYAYIFSDNCAYVGLTINPDIRFKNHLADGPVFDKISQGFTHEIIILEDHIANNILGEREIYYIQMLSNQYHLLNIKKGGGRGGLCCKWNKNKIQASANKYKTRGEWKKNDENAYHAARHHGVLDECCGHMTSARINWTDDAVINDAKKFNSLSEWRTSKSYSIANSRNLIKKCSEHMTSKKTRFIRRTWTHEEIIADAAKYNFFNEWRCSSTGYSAAHRRKIIKLCSSHMIRQRKID